MIRLRTLREDAGMYQYEVADYLGTSLTMYARYENGHSALPIRHLIQLCKLYNVSSDEILGLQEFPKHRKLSKPNKTKKPEKAKRHPKWRDHGSR